MSRGLATLRAVGFSRPNERGSTTSNRLLLHRACASFSLLLLPVYSSVALDGGLLKGTNGCSQWFLSRLAKEKPTARRAGVSRRIVDGLDEGRKEGRNSLQICLGKMV